VGLNVATTWERSNHYECKVLFLRRSLLLLFSLSYLYLWGLMNGARYRVNTLIFISVINCSLQRKEMFRIAKTRCYIE